MNARETPEEPDYDVIVVGAGPAGATLALCLKRLAPEIAVALLDKSEFPRDKPCGDGLGPGVRRVLSDLGDLDLLDGYDPIEHVTIAGPSDTVVHASLSGREASPVTGFVIPRAVFDERLVQRSREVGVTVLTGHRFVAMDQQRSHVRLTVSLEGRGTREMTARYVVGADGAGSRVRRALEEPRNDDRHTAIAIRAYATCEYSSPQSRSSLFLKFADPYLPAYGWVFPIDDGTANIGIGVGVDQLKKLNLDLETLLDRFAQDLEPHGYRIDGIADRATRTLPLASHIPRLAHGRVALIGDAGSMINPTTGEGIQYGMEAGRMLAHHLSRARVSDVDLSLWEKQFRDRFEKHFRSSAFARYLLRRKLWARIMFRAARSDDSIVDEGVSMMFGDGAIGLTDVGRVLRAAVVGRRSNAR